MYFTSMGFRGQRVFVIPEHNLIVVRLGFSNKQKFDFNKWVANIISVVPKAENIPIEEYKMIDSK